MYFPQRHLCVPTAPTRCALVLAAALLATCGTSLAAAVELSLDLQSPRGSLPGAASRGVPRDMKVFEFSAPEPLSSLERARWAVLRFSRIDREWRDERMRAGPLRVSERYNSVDLLGGITRVGEYYTTIRIGGQRVRVQVDVSLERWHGSFRIRCNRSRV
jgi:hypothetical protein